MSVLSVLQLETDHALGTNKGISEKSLGLEDILTTPIEHNNGEPAWHNKGACLQPTIGYRGACAQYHSILHQLSGHSCLQMLIRPAANSDALQMD
jgi:hypothetical protein